MGTPKSNLMSNKLFVLDEEFYPECWKDDARMGVFLAEFRVKSLNPDNYESKMRFWKELIASYCEYKGSSNVSISELKAVFKRKGTSPYCLQTVFDDMLANGEIQPKQTFLEAPQDTWAGWAVNSLVKKPFSWGFGKVKEQFVAAKDENSEFIVTEVVKYQAGILEKHVQSINENNTVIAIGDVLKDIKEKGITPEGAHLVIQQMRIEQKVYSDSSSNTQENEKQILLKFAGPNLKAMPITDIERSIYNMECTEKSLLKVIEKLEGEISEVMVSVRSCIQDGKRQTAKTHLKKKHVLEKNLDKKLNVLENVQAMLARIHDSQSDKNVIEAYKIGSNALKSAFASSGITVDSVDDTIAEMREILESQDEMQSMISVPQATAEIEDLELEQELADLLDMKLMENEKIILPPTPKIEKDFDEEIEKRLARLRTDIPNTQPGGPTQEVVRNLTSQI